MKKIFVLLLALAVVFGFASCSGNTTEYADETTAASLVDSINKANVAADILAAANEGTSNGLTIAYDFTDADSIADAIENGGDVSIDVVAMITSEYSNGLWQAADGKDVPDRSITAGTAKVTVTGTFSVVEGTGYKLDIKSYSAETTLPVKIKEGTTEYTFELEKLNGTASGTITLNTATGDFSVENISLTVPSAGDVEAWLDGKLVNYTQLCTDTGFNPGDKVTL